MKSADLISDVLLCRVEIAEYFSNKKTLRRNVVILLDPICDPSVELSDYIHVDVGYVYATVVCVGNEVCNVKLRDRIVISKYCGTAIEYHKFSSMKLKLISEDQIDCVVI